jgi:hypothetical protein
MLARFLDHEVPIRQLVALALVLGIPYVFVGFGWALTHQDHIASLSGLDALFSFIGEIIAWPPLVISDITLK